jgi:hypothetical protein
MPRIRSERPAFDAKFPQLAVDTSRDATLRLQGAPGDVTTEPSGETKK